MKLKKLVSNRCPTANLWYSQLTIRQKALRRRPTRTSKTSKLRKMLASPLYIREREEHEGQARAYHSERESLMIHSSRNPEVSGKPDAECVQKREATAQRTQVYHSQRESLMIHSSRNPEVSGKPDAECVQKREATAQRTQVYHSQRESLMTSSSRDLTVNRVRTRFPKETEVTKRETASRVVFILFLDLLTRQMLGNHFSMDTRIICLIKQGLNI